MKKRSEGECISRLVNAFQDRTPPEPMRTAGYSALIDHYQLKVPLPSRLAGIAKPHHKIQTSQWEILTPRHAPHDTLEGHLEFALKWEGVNLLVLSALFGVTSEKEVRTFVEKKPTGTYTRRLWFLYEWLTNRQLDVNEPGKVRAVPILDLTQQFGLSRGTSSSRHKIIDNLPGTAAFCPLVRRTEKIENYLSKGLDRQAKKVVGETHADVMRRAAAFMLLDDSRASFQIEGEKPSRQRAERWAKAIGEAGSRALTVDELERLQKIVIGDSRFVSLGLRTEGGFVGTHDRKTQEPIPVHISARNEDLRSLLDGVVVYDRRASGSGIDPVIVAAALSFGFVYIHPFEDGNGRVHRWLIHHALAIAGYNPPGVVFPVSAAIYRDIPRYKSVLESYSRPLLDFIEWEPTNRGNVRVLNQTANYYRYFDATAHAEFLCDCVEQTIERDLPNELRYLKAYDRFANGIQKLVDMPERKLNLLREFLQQGQGHLSKRARSNEFVQLSDAEVEEIEGLYEESFSALGNEDDGEKR